MAAPNRWAVREAAEATFYDLVSKDPVVTLTTLKMTEVQTTGETVYSQGGRGNAKIVGFSGNREATVTLQDAIFDNAALAMLTGNEITTGARTLQFYEDVTLGAGGTATLKRAPIEAEAYPVVAGAIGVLAPSTIAAKELSVTSGAEGERYRVYYTAEVGDAKTVTVTASDFGGTFRLVCDVLVTDAETGRISYGQFIAPRAKIEDDFTFSFSPEGDPSVLDIPLEILKDSASDNMWELIIFGDE